MRTFDQTSAKKYIIEIILEQARRDGVELSEAEKYNLAWSESDPDFVRNEALDKEIEEAIPMEQFEAKIEGIIKRAYEANISVSKEKKQEFRQAYRALKTGDHYVLVMLNNALGMKVHSWWPF